MYAPGEDRRALLTHRAPTLDSGEGRLAQVSFSVKS